MDAAVHRTPKTKGREPVSSATKVGADFATVQPETRAQRRSRTVSAAEGYECWAPIYDQVPNPLLAREERHLLPLLTNLREQSVLDVACGTGRWLEKVMEQGCRSAVGIDCSAAMLRVAGSKHALRGRLVRADCQDLPLPCAFDVAICSFALGHIQDLGSIVRELARVTKPDADIFVSDLHPEAYARGWRVGFREGATAVEIEMQSRAVPEVVHTFCANLFSFQVQETLWLGEPERSLFAKAGKSHLFIEACTLPAVLFCHFRRAGKYEERRAQ